MNQGFAGILEMGSIGLFEGDTNLTPGFCFLMEEGGCIFWSYVKI